MSKIEKKAVRQAFRDAVFKRAGYRCQGPGCRFVSSQKKAEEELDSHHITERFIFPNGGYIAANGIALCPSCHLKAEEVLQGKANHKGFFQRDLYSIIDSSFDKAREADKEQGECNG